MNLLFDELKDKILESLQNSENKMQEPIEVIELLDYLISWIPIEISKNWTKFSTYFEVFILLI